jgi:tryptophan halogenase
MSERNALNVRKVVVLGGGSAGLLVALALATRAANVQTVVVRSTKMGVIGVGEGTIASIGRFLHDFLNIEPHRFHREVHPSIKLGIQFQWGSQTPFHYAFAPQFSSPNPPQLQLSLPRGYYCNGDATYADLASALMFHGKVAAGNEQGGPRLPQLFAYHLENRRFVEFLEKFSTEKGVEKIDAVVRHVALGPSGVEALELDTGERLEADLFVDCSGFRSELIAGALKEPFVRFDDALLCDRALVGGWTRTDDAYNAFTTAESMDAGWCWRIEHDEIINRGYVYASNFISDDEAEAEFRAKNPKLGEVRMLTFRSGVHRRAWVDNVVAIGNSYGFVEPLEATAIGMICGAAANLAHILLAGADCVTDAQRNIFNSTQDENWSQIRDFLALHYKPNRRDRTPFWDACRHDVPLGAAQDIYDYYQVVGPDFRALEPRLRRDIFGPEGYLALLVGQGVPYRRRAQIPESERAAWRRYRSRLVGVMDRALGAAAYQSLLRRGEVQLPLRRFPAANASVA